jgi:hypothetical protein
MARSFCQIHSNAFTILGKFSLLATGSKAMTKNMAQKEPVAARPTPLHGAA